ncbi:transglutaminase TgpA family protein [Paenibacillus faecalis]|uniref:transglutaminase TgpA family protein n=1 Tax=Paenibacillus faecalis TaxID=2079532 RepID=UPI000D0E99C0|nr:transglutaminase domain-containing protein [Paenibacillus faecalis]
MKSWTQKFALSFFYILSLLWIWLILLQWVSYTEPLLYEETTAVIIAALAITAITESLVMIKRGFRILIQLGFIIFAVSRILEKYNIPVPSSLLEGLGSEQMLEFLPYLWFAVASWAIFLFAAVWATNKRRILLVIGLNVIAFAIFDSFTTYVLWDETAWIVAAGMGWLVTDHFKRFRKRFPVGWSKLRAYPFKIIGNILVIFSLIILAGINMPTIKPSLTDPYTAWREWNGIPLSGSVSGTGDSILEIPGESMSGYGREDNELGGGFNFDYTPVMTVTSDERSYWRGETRTQYSGTGWSDKQRRRDFEDILTGEDLEGDLSDKIETKALEQTVTMLNDNVYPVLFGAYSISKVDRLDPDVEEGRLLWKAEGSELHLESEPKRLSYPKTYTVTSEVPIIPMEELSAKTYEQLYPEPIDEKYLQKPSGFPERVERLAEEVTAAGETPYEKVILLQQYLQNNFTYSNTPDLTKRKSPDFVESFLFEVQEGYCDYFSTSMVMMTRSLDIPARWVKGYAPGNMSAPEFMSQSGEESIRSGSYTVTNADAHSWVEVYFGDYGWIPIETTPGFSMPILAGSEPLEPEVPEDEEEKVEEVEETAATPEESGENSSLYMILGILSGTIILAWIGYIAWRMRFNLRFFSARLRAGKPLTPADKVIAETERWLRYVHRRGLKRGPNETLRESVRRWESLYPTLAGSLTPLLKKFEAARYSPVHILEEEWRAVQSEAAQLKKSIKRVKIS